MPLEKAAVGTPGFSRNIATEMKAGKPQKQAVAIAYNKARGDAAPKVEIKRQTSNEANVSQRSVTFDVYVNGKYEKTFRDINDALDYKDKMTSRSDASSIAYGYKVNGNTRGTYGTQAEAAKKAREAKAKYPGATVMLFSYDTAGDGSEKDLRMDAAKADCVYEEQGQFWFRRPGFREANGPFASEQEANEAAVKMGVAADADTRTPQEKLAIAKRMYEQDLRSASSPAERAQIKEDFEHFKRAMVKAGAKADAGERTIKKSLLDQKLRDGLWELVWEPDRNGRATIKHSRGGKQETVRIADASDPCWEGYHAEGMKEKGGKSAPNCVSDSSRATDKTPVGTKVIHPDTKQVVSVTGRTKRPLPGNRGEYTLLRVTGGSFHGPADLKIADSEPEGEAILGKRADAFESLSSAALRQRIRAIESDIEENKKAGRSTKNLNDLLTKMEQRLAMAIKQEKGGTKADAAVGFDKSRPDKPWFASVNGKKQYFAFRQQAEAAKDSAKADSTPQIVREGDQWIIQVTNGAEKSIFRLSAKEYPTEAAALEYATTNPQYTNSKATNILDSVLSAADELFARAAKADAERDLPGAGTGEGGYDS